MLDSQIETIIQSTLVAGLATRGIAGVGVMQNNQPRQFSAPSTPTLFFTYGSRKKWGWPDNKDALNPDGLTFTRTTTQVIHTRYTVAGLGVRSPATPDALTSGDLASIAASILTAEDSITAYVAQQCNVFRVQDLPGVWFQDSSGQNVLWASFDIIFTHKDVYTSTIGAISEFVGNVGIV